MAQRLLWVDLWVLHLHVPPRRAQDGRDAVLQSSTTCDTGCWAEEGSVMGYSGDGCLSPRRWMSESPMPTGDRETTEHGALYSLRQAVMCADTAYDGRAPHGCKVCGYKNLMHREEWSNKARTSLLVLERLARRFNLLDGHRFCLVSTFHNGTTARAQNAANTNAELACTCIV